MLNNWHDSKINKYHPSKWLRSSTRNPVVESKHICNAVTSHHFYGSVTQNSLLPSLYFYTLQRSHLKIQIISCYSFAQIFLLPYFSEQTPKLLHWPFRTWSISLLPLGPHPPPLLKLLVLSFSTPDMFPFWGLWTVTYLCQHTTQQHTQTHTTHLSFKSLPKCYLLEKV